MAAATGSVNSGTSTSGRNEDVWGMRRVAQYRVTLTSGAPVGGFPWDPRAQGFDRPVASVWIQRRFVLANVALGRYQFIYDYVNKAILPLDSTDAFDDGNGDDLSGVILDVLVFSD